MFSGTIRSNLDPTGSLASQADKGNAALWAALESVGLDGKIRSLKGDLDAPVAEFGENLSQGERQLLCLSRVLLRRCRVIMMDEASSSLGA
jgi:ABC-type multidrug transport system fused ATPase/permease subunit